MLFRVLRVGLLTVASVVGLGLSESVQAQFTCGQSYGAGYGGGYGSGYGSGYGFQGSSLYGQPGMYQQSNYLPQQSYGLGAGYAAPPAVVNQSFYPGNSGYNSGYNQVDLHHHHSHHPWHPGHYLMGHY